MFTMKTMKCLAKDPNKLYAEVEKLLYSLAWTTSKTYYVPFDECLSECNYAFVKAFNWRYDPKKGTKFSTQVATIAKWRLRSLVRTRTLTIPTLELNEEIAGFAPPDRSPCMEAIEDLSKDAREILALLFETPADILEEATTPKRLLSKVKQHLIDNGSDRRRLELAHAEIATRLQHVWQMA